MPTVREVLDTDLDGVAALNQVAGWAPPHADEWTHLWRDNPARQDRPDTARGWTMLEGPRIVGFLANVVQLYRLGSKPVTAASAGSLVVHPDFRGSSLQLYMAFVRQSGVDLLLNTTAAPQVSQISEFLKFKRIPQPDYNRTFYWVLRPWQFAPAALRKKGFSPLVAGLGRPALGAALYLEGALRRRGPRAAPWRGQLRFLTAGDVGPAFDAHWERLAATSSVLLANRDARTLRWHFAARGRPHAPQLVGAFDGERLVGYAAVIRRDGGHLGLSRARLADLTNEDDDPQVTRRLLWGAADVARRNGASMLEVVGFPAAVRRLCEEAHPFQLIDDSWPFLYRVRDSTLATELAGESAWRACLYDGDGSL